MARLQARNDARGKTVSSGAEHAAGNLTGGFQTRSHARSTRTGRAGRPVVRHEIAGMGRSDRAYAGLLPAGGVVILFLSVYGAHLYYAFIGASAALSAVLLICVLSLWLCQAFQSTLYAFFAVAGTYSAPFLLHSIFLDVSDLAIYYSCWSVVFCWFSIRVGTRSVYLLALYLA